MKVTAPLAFVCLILGLCVASAPAAAPAAADKSDKPAKKEDAKAKPINAKCPVEHEDIDPEITTTYKGKTVAFCCESCIKDFKKDPEKYMKQIAADNKKAEEEKKAGKDKGKSAEKDAKAEGKSDAKAVKTVNTVCAVNPDDAVDPTVTTRYKGKLIGFCCEDCQKKFDLDPDKYAAKLK
jgi:YHS domain-containing protein